MIARRTVCPAVIHFPSVPLFLRLKTRERERERERERRLSRLREGGKGLSELGFRSRLKSFSHRFARPDVATSCKLDHHPILYAFCILYSINPLCAFNACNAAFESNQDRFIAFHIHTERRSSAQESKENGPSAMINDERRKNREGKLRRVNSSFGKAVFRGSGDHEGISPRDTRHITPIRIGNEVDFTPHGAVLPGHPV